MFRVYKPKGLFRIKAVQVTGDNVQEIAAMFMGRVSLENDVLTGVDLPTLDGVKHFPLNDWIVRTESNSLKHITNEEFEETYEVAVNRTANAS
jgi:hypothetical protein